MSKMQNRQQRRASKQTTTKNQFMDMGISAIQSKNFSGAYVYLGKAVELQPKNHECWYLFGIAATFVHRKNEAMQAHFKALELMPNNRKYLDSFCNACRAVQIIGYSAELKKAVLKCLMTKDLNVQSITDVWWGLIRLGEEYQDSFSFDKITKDEKHDLFSKLSKDQFITTGLSRLIPRVPELEEWISNLRHALFNHFLSTEDNKAKKQYIGLMQAIGAQMFLNEYVFWIDKEQSKNFDRFRKHKIEPNLSDIPETDLVAYSMYEPIKKLGDEEALNELEKSHKFGAIKHLIKSQITQMKEEKALARDIPIVGEIKDDVSANVRAMYEENPYPRWEMSGEERMQIKDPDLSYLVAGCGTGNSTAAAYKTFPESEITGIDLSLASMGYAKRKLNELKAKNVSFYHCDILNVGALNKTFDIIECGGVLHHMDEPAKGWQALIDVLKPGGRMIISLYSRMARRNIIASQEYAVEKGYGYDLDGIRQFRKDIFEMSEDNEMKLITKGTDFYTTSMCRDMSFHVQEHCYDLPGLKEMMDDLGLVLTGFKLPREIILSLYLKEFPDDPELKNIENWTKFEEKNRDAFTEMYSFYCMRKSDADVKNPSITPLLETKLVR